MTTMHRHKAITTSAAPYTGCVARHENRAAHGNVCEVERCLCGAERRTNVNGRHTERGEWYVPTISVRLTGGEAVRRYENEKATLGPGRLPRWTLHISAAHSSVSSRSSCDVAEARAAIERGEYVYADVQVPVITGT